MPNCVMCNQSCKAGFNYFCRSCYRSQLKRLRITDADFPAYINLSFRTNLTFPPHLSFVEIHRWLSLRVPTLKPLACLLESILFLKFALKKD